MKKSRLMLHIATVFGILFFAFMAISSSASTPNVVIENAIQSSKTTSEGVVFQMPTPNLKNFEILDLVFATSISNFDENGLIIASQEG